VAQQGNSWSAGENALGKLAQFFPEAAPVRIPVRVSAFNIAGGGLCEDTVIEFGTPREVLFTSTLPLEFADKLRLENKDGSLRAEVFVVALQYEHGKTAVAARFLRNVPNWIVKR
jgi:hypothetical protein